MNDWYLEWDMDGMQWEVLQIDLYEEEREDRGKIGTYHECFKFIHDHLLDTRKFYKMPNIFMHCTEGTFKLTNQDVITVLTNYCPEELI